jgi:hypothetical protein
MAAEIGKLFKGGGAAEQLLIWAVLGQVIGAVLAPELELIQREVFKALPSTPLSPAALAEMVVRHVVGEADGESYARESGIAPQDFRRLVQTAGEGPAPVELAEALRRGLIPEKGQGADATSFEQGLAESHLRDKWAEVIKRLAVREPTPIDPLEALLEGQLSEEEARNLYQRFGGDPEHFTWLFNSRGSAPTPLEAIEMANRGIIPWEGEGAGVVSYIQAFLEGPWRNKWAEPYRKLGEYRPPARTITAMVRSGSLSDERALELFKDIGMTAEIAQAMLDDAHHEKLAPTRQLALGMVEQLYREQIVSAEDATGMLGALHYTAEEAALILQLQDLQRAVKATDAAIGRIHTLYVTRKIDRSRAVGALSALHVPPAQQEDLVATWDVERSSNVKVLTAAEIASAHYYKIIDQPLAIQELVGIGYTPLDAWILLSVRSHKPLDNMPAPGPAT